MIEDFLIGFFALNRETYVQEHSSLDVRVDVEHLVEIDFDVLLKNKIIFWSDRWCTFPEIP